MQKIILDTNVIVSALISNSAPTRILYDVVLQLLAKPCISPEILEEYEEVLGRAKFDRFVNFRWRAEIILFKMKEISAIYHPTKKVEILTDASDNKFLELAAASSADFLIIGNILDFTISHFESTQIVTPREYWDNHRPIV